MFKQVFVLILLVAAVFVESAFFIVADGENNPFTFVVELTDRKQIQHARDLVSGRTKENPHIAGRIIKKTAPYNRSWSFHFNPDKVLFFDGPKNLNCDFTFKYVDDHLDDVGYWICPENYFCPQGSRFIREFRPRKSYLQSSFEAGRRYLSNEKQEYSD